jgi:predicted acylesterase/phospholipase RssA
VARALTGKQVGIALGGAGAWGLAGAVLIQELEKRGVPIDMIAGSSSGALIGAHYCVGGSDGIERLVSRGPELSRTMWMMSFTSAIAEVGFDEELLGARLEALEIPLLPIVSNLSKRRAEVIVEGSAGLGIRASVCAPGVFGPTLIGDQVYVDGAMTDNHPTGLVESLGAALVVSGNLLPAARLRVGQHESSTFWGRVAGNLDPIGRMNDTAAALALFVHMASAPEPSPHHITYEPEAVSAPLLHTFEYNKAAAIVAHARQDRLLHATVDAAERAWKGLLMGRRT